MSCLTIGLFFVHSTVLYHFCLPSMICLDFTLFQAHLLLSSKQRHALGISDSKEDTIGNSLAEICKNMISAFNTLRRADE